MDIAYRRRQGGNHIAAQQANGTVSPNVGVQ